MNTHTHTDTPAVINDSLYAITASRFRTLNTGNNKGKWLKYFEFINFNKYGKVHP